MAVKAIGQGPRRFVSTDLLPRWRDVLIPALTRAHAEDPFTPKEPRRGLRRANRVLTSLGLTAVTIRGVVDTAGVEVGHIWLAVAGDGGEPWVLDPSFPLHTASFTGLLHGYVAGDLTIRDLELAAAGLDMDTRVVGRLPRGTGYRGEPVWTAAQG